MRALVASCCFVALLVVGISPASAEGTRRVDLVVRDVPTGPALDLRAEGTAPLTEGPPAKATPLHVPLDGEGRLELLLRVSRDQFVGKLAVAL